MEGQFTENAGDVVIQWYRDGRDAPHKAIFDEVTVIDLTEYRPVETVLKGDYIREHLADVRGFEWV